MQGKNDKEIRKVMIKIGKLLVKHREENGFSSYEKFSFYADLSRSGYFNHEKGKNMTLETLIHILGCMNVGIADFFESINEDTKTLYPPMQPPPQRKRRKK